MDSFIGDLDQTLVLAELLKNEELILWIIFFIIISPFILIGLVMLWGSRQAAKDQGDRASFEQAVIFPLNDAANLAARNGGQISPDHLQYYQWCLAQVSSRQLSHYENAWRKARQGKVPGAARLLELVKAEQANRLINAGPGY